MAPVVTTVGGVVQESSPPMTITMVDVRASLVVRLMVVGHVWGS